MAVILGLGIGVAAVAVLLVVFTLARRRARSLRRMATSIEEANLGEEVPETGSDEEVALARTVNRMRADAASRIEALEEERKSRDAILSALEEGVVLFDAQGSAVYQNERARGLLGASVENVRSLAARSLQDAVGAAANGGTARPVDVVMGAASRTIRATATSVPGDGHVLLVLRDVTQARMVDAVRRDFVANASHELKTPVASISALAETIFAAAQNDPEAVPRFAVQLDREAVRLARVISDLLDLSRLEGEAGERTDLRLDRLAAQEAARFGERVDDGGLTLTIRTGSAVRVSGSERDLRLLIRNLVENAVQYTRPGGTVDVRVHADGDHAVLEVRDSGIGIPTRDRARVFERFYRVDRARSRETGGTGLGLSIVRHVVENHGGSVSVESELGRGSTFTVLLPLAG